MKGIVLLSGGMDSTTALAQAVADGCSEILALNVSYGSKHNSREEQSAIEVVEWYNKRNEVESITFENLSIAGIFKGAKSALMGSIPMPHMTYQEIAASEGPSPTVVPFRNGVLLSIAAAIASSRGYDAVFIGAHAEDARNWAYPDCTPEFMGAMANSIFIGTYQKVRLVFPLIWMTKEDVVTRAACLDAPLQLTYSCYEGRSAHCGKCPTCVERIHAFIAAGFNDPVSYEDESLWEGVGSLEIWPTLYGKH
jgi:7-cyano-7-deazaguanine synthase